MRYVALILILLVGTANAAEVWECQAGSWVRNGKVLITATTGEDDVGSIEVAGTTQATEYRIRGFDRRWDFGPLTEHEIYSYAFIIEPSGAARYYDFTLADEDGRTTSSQYYFCKQKPNKPRITPES